MSSPSSIQSESKAPSSSSESGLIVASVLETDGKFRIAGVTGDLHRLEDLTHKNWDFSSPTLVPKEECDSGDEDADEKYYQIGKIRPTVADFRAAFNAQHPLIARIGLKKDCNVFVAGGAVGAQVRAPAQHGHVPFDGDVDLFVYGLGPREADAKVEELHDRLISAAHQIPREQIIRNLEAECLRLEKAEKKARNADRQSRYRAATPSDDDDKEEESAAGPARKAKNWGRVISDIPWVRSRADKNWIELDRSKLPSGLQPHILCGYRAPEVLKIRNKRCLTLQIDNYCRIQIIFRLYASKSEILHGFDLGTSAVGFDGDEVLFTSLGKFTYEYECLIADTSRRSTTFEARLYKYWRRGFKIILPLLNIGALRTEYLKWRLAEVAELPLFPFAYTAISNNRISVEKFLFPGGRSSDYGPKLTSANEVSERDIVAVNMAHILQGDDDLYYISRRDKFGGLEIDQGEDPVFVGPPHISLAMVHSLYDTARAKVYKAGKLDMGIIRRFLPGLDTTALVSAILSNDEPRPESKPLLDAAFEAYRTKAVAAHEKMMGSWRSAIPWIIENPGTQLTSSVNPIIEDPEKWYGKYLAGPAHAASSK